MHPKIQFKGTLANCSNTPAQECTFFEISEWRDQGRHHDFYPWGQISRGLSVLTRWASQSWGSPQSGGQYAPFCFIYHCIHLCAVWYPHISNKGLQCISRASTTNQIRIDDARGLLCHERGLCVPSNWLDRASRPPWLVQWSDLEMWEMLAIDADIATLSSI